MTTSRALPVVLAWASGGLLIGSAPASPPIDPLPVPLYSFDLASPTVQNLALNIDAGDVLTFGFPHPIVLVQRERLRLFSRNDELDGLSGDNASMPPTARFAFLFSVDRATVGVASPDPNLVRLKVPFNVKDQAARGHAAGDEFLTTRTYVRAGGGPALVEPKNNTLAHNNFDEGGNSFSAEPEGAAGSELGDPNEDNVDGTGYLPEALTRVVNVYFSLSRQSPSLPQLTQYVSGATLFYNADPNMNATTEVYAPFFQLGLVQQDDIDGLILFDMNRNGRFDSGDEVYYSLTRDSPSLQTIPGVSPQGAAADIIRTRFGFPPEVFVNADDFGLGAVSDNIDALEVVLCEDGFNCAARHGIRWLPGDTNCDGEVNFADINPFVAALADPNEYRRLYPQCHIIYADCNGDKVVNFADINKLVELLGGGDEPRGQDAMPPAAREPVNGRPSAETSPATGGSPVDAARSDVLYQL